MTGFPHEYRDEIFLHQPTYLDHNSGHMLSSVIGSRLSYEDLGSWETPVLVRLRHNGIISCLSSGYSNMVMLSMEDVFVQDKGSKLEK